MATPDSAPGHPSPPPPPGRLAALDWLRGLAVVLMIQAHGFDAWLGDQARAGAAWEVIRQLSAIPARLFLVLVGVSIAVRFERQMAAGVGSALMRAQVWRRGLLVLALAYLFRLQEHALAGFGGSWDVIFRVDILNAIGASMLLVGAIATPRRGRRRSGAALAAAAVFVALGPVIGPARFPDWLPRPLTSYIGGERPMAWFPIFPWGAWALVGVALGHLWVRASADPRAEARFLGLLGAGGAITAGAALGARALLSDVVVYPSEVVEQMGPEAFFHRLGMIGALALVAWAVTRRPSGRFSPLRQLGQTSLLVYWIHVDLCYGPLSRSIQRSLEVPRATLWVVLLTLAMLAISVLKTRHGARALAWARARLGPLLSRARRRA